MSTTAHISAPMALDFLALTPIRHCVPGVMASAESNLYGKLARASAHRMDPFQGGDGPGVRATKARLSGTMAHQSEREA